MITSKKLLKQKKISHGFFNRNGGSSSGIYKSLNCGPGSNDNKNNIKKNLKIVKNRINKKSKKIFLIHQIHSNKFIFIDRNFKSDTRKIKVDAIVTDRRKFPIGVLTADCAPILLFDKKKKFIAAIHAGWKGAFKGIITKVIKFMIRKGCKPKNIVAAIGPCIGKKNYNVKEDFKKKFIIKSKKNKIFFSCNKTEIYFDLASYLKSELKFNKITNIDMKNIDTFIKKNNFFSARQALRSGHDDYGRNISIIMLN